MRAMAPPFTQWVCRALWAVLSVGGACLAHGARANDSSQGVTPGELSMLGAAAPPALSITQATVRVSGQLVTVSLTPKSPFRSQTSLVLTGAAFGWLGEAEPYPDRHFPEMRFSSDEQTIAPNESFAAFVGTTDVSALLREAGVSPWLIADTPPLVSPDDIKPETLAKLIHAGVLAKTGDGYLARWRAQRTLSITLASGRAIAITYRLRPAYAMLHKQALSAPALRKRYCISTQQLRTLLREWATTPQYVVKQYDIPVSVNQRPPRSVRLSFEPEPGVAFVATCATHGAGVSGVEGLSDIAAKPDQRGLLRILTIDQATP